MWARRTFHECAEELDAISKDFRTAHTNRLGWDRSTCNRVMLESSRRGVEVLRILALAIRSEQDFGLTNKDHLASVGALRAKVPRDEVSVAIKRYRPPYGELKGCTPLALRQALNKIAHADPTRSGFFADDNTHDLILSGMDRGDDAWIAVVSLIDLSRVIKSLPNARTQR